MSPVGKKAKEMGKMLTLICKAECLFIISHREKVGQHPPMQATSPAVNQECVDAPLAMPGVTVPEVMRMSGNEQRALHSRKAL